MKSNIYLTFNGDCAKAFDLYKSVFGGDFSWKATFGSSPMKQDIPAENHGDIMHMALPIGENMELMGSDYNPVMHKNKLVIGTNTQISLSVDSKGEADRIYKALSNTSTHPMKEMFWGSYFGCFTDSFGVQWMIDCPLVPKNDKELLVSKPLKDISSSTKTASPATDQLEQLYSPVSKKAKQQK